MGGYHQVKADFINHQSNHSLGSQPDSFSFGSGVAEGLYPWHNPPSTDVGGKVPGEAGDRLMWRRMFELSRCVCAPIASLQTPT